MRTTIKLGDVLPAGVEDGGDTGALPPTSSWRLATQANHLPDLAEAAIEAGQAGKAVGYAPDTDRGLADPRSG